MLLVRPGELRDTTNPPAIAQLCSDLLGSESLKQESRQRPLAGSAYDEAPKPWGGPLRDRDLAVLAEAGRIAAAWWQSQPPLAAAQAR